MSKYKLLEVYGKRIRTLSGILSVLLFALLITPVLFESASEYAVADMPLGGSGSGPGGTDGSMIDGGAPDPSSGSSDSSDSSGDADGSTGGDPTSGGDGLTSGDTSGDGSITSGDSSGGDGSGSGDASSGDGSTTTGGESATGGDNSSSGGDGSSTGGDTSSGGDDDEDADEGSSDGEAPGQESEGVGNTCLDPVDVADKASIQVGIENDGTHYVTTPPICLSDKGRIYQLRSKKEARKICKSENRKLWKGFLRTKRAYKDYKKLADGSRDILNKLKRKFGKKKSQWKLCQQYNMYPVTLNYALMDPTGNISTHMCPVVDRQTSACPLNKVVSGLAYNVGMWISVEGEDGPLSTLRTVTMP